MNLDFFNEKNMVRVAWIQAAISVPCLVIFPFLNTEWKINLLGLVTMVTWTGTALAHISAARADKKAIGANNNAD